MRYYVPSIEEFHVGFEYEMKDIADDLVSETWRKLILDNPYDMSTIERYLDTTSDIRVKYLDREDIEKLGWRQYGDFDNWFCKKVRGYEAYYYLTPTTFHGQNSWMIEFDIIVLDIEGKVEKIYKKQDTLFDGKIKNKSELKKLFKMIQIQ
jgi:hypothetical protein